MSWEGRPAMALLSGKEEDRFTSYLCELLKSREVLAGFLSKLCGVAPNDLGTAVEVRTQVTVPGGRPDLVIELNGGISSLAEVAEHLVHVDAVMVGRAAWDDPFAFAHADRELFGEADSRPTRRDAVERMCEYLGRSSVERPAHVVRVMAGLATGRPGARAWRRALAEVAAARDPASALRRALAVLPREVLEEE